MYVAYLSRSLLPQSIAPYLNFVGLIHKEVGLPNPLLGNWTLNTVGSGLRRLRGTPPRPRLPITIDILKGLRACLNLGNSRHASFWAICLTSFFGLFRKFRLLPVSTRTFDASKQFTRSDFSHTSSGYVITVRWSKTIQMGQRTLLIPLVPFPGSELCPVSAINNAFAFTGPHLQDHHKSQVFCYVSSSRTIKIFTYKMFMEYMKIFLSRLGVDHAQYGTHSFRRGGASFALNAGVSLDTISIMGDWKSDVMFLYLLMPLSQRLAAQQVLASHISS